MSTLQLGVEEPFGVVDRERRSVTDRIVGTQAATGGRTTGPGRRIEMVAERLDRLQQRRLEPIEVGGVQRCVGHDPDATARSARRPL